MWKKINSNLRYSGMIIGNMITDNPGDPSDSFVVRSIHDGYVKALHINGKSAIKFFPESELLNGKWWVKDKE
jgi:hypothetical protein